MNIPQILLNKPAPGAKLNLSHPLAKGLVGCWLFNEQTGLYAFDSSPYKNHGKLVNFNDPTSKDRSSLGLEFDGISKYVNCGNDPSLDITEAITIEAWVKSNGADKNGYIISKGNPYAANGGYSIYWQGTIDKILLIDNNVEYSSNAVFVDNNVYVHLTMTSDGNGNIKFYRNGIAAGTETATLTSNSDDLYLGNRVGGTEGATYFNGSIDGVKIYNRVLVKDEIILAYQHPYAMFNKR